MGLHGQARMAGDDGGQSASMRVRDGQRQGLGSNSMGLELRVCRRLPYQQMACGVRPLHACGLKHGVPNTVVHLAGTMPNSLCTTMRKHINPRVFSVAQSAGAAPNTALSLAHCTTYDFCNNWSGQCCVVGALGPLVRVCASCPHATHDAVAVVPTLVVWTVGRLCGNGLWCPACGRRCVIICFPTMYAPLTGLVGWKVRCACVCRAVPPVPRRFCEFACRAACTCQRGFRG